MITFGVVNAIGHRVIGAMAPGESERIHGEDGTIVDPEFVAALDDAVNAMIRQSMRVAPATFIEFPSLDIRVRIDYLTEEYRPETCLDRGLVSYNVILPPEDGNRPQVMPPMYNRYAALLVVFTRGVRIPDLE